MLISPSLRGPTHLLLACTWADQLLDLAEKAQEIGIEEVRVRITEIEEAGEVIDQDQGHTPVDAEITLPADVKDPTHHADIKPTLKISCAAIKDLHISKTSPKISSLIFSIDERIFE